jgi:RimJ/RimL family protein N-acetyltransferase
MTTFLNEFQMPKAPLRYGTDLCCLVMADSTYSQDLVALRNDPSVGRFLNKVNLTLEEHERWISSRYETRNVLDFVVLIEGKFAGNISLSDTAIAQQCELGRFIMPADGRRIFSLAVEFLAMSFAFEVLRLAVLYCAVVEENEATWRFHLENGWILFPPFDRDHVVNGRSVHLLGMRITRLEWKSAFDRMQPRVKRLMYVPYDSESSSPRAVSTLC